MPFNEGGDTHSEYDPEDAAPLRPYPKPEPDVPEHLYEEPGVAERPAPDGTEADDGVVSLSRCEEDDTEVSPAEATVLPPQEAAAPPPEVHEVEGVREAEAEKAEEAEDAEKAEDAEDAEKAEREAEAVKERKERQEAKEQAAREAGEIETARIEQEIEEGRNLVRAWDDESRDEIELAGQGVVDALLTAVAARFTAESFTPAYEALAPDSFGRTLGSLGTAVAALTRGNLVEWSVGKAVTLVLTTVAGVPPLPADLIGRTVTAFLTERSRPEVVETEHVMDATLAVNIALYAAHGKVFESPAVWFLAQSKSTKAVTTELKGYTDRLLGREPGAAAAVRDRHGRDG